MGFGELFSIGMGLLGGGGGGGPQTTSVEPWGPAQAPLKQLFADFNNLYRRRVAKQGGGAAPTEHIAPGAPTQAVQQYITERRFEGGGKEGHGDWIEETRLNPAWKPGMSQDAAETEIWHPEEPIWDKSRIAPTSERFGQYVDAASGYEPTTELSSDVLERLDNFGFGAPVNQIVNQGYDANAVDEEIERALNPVAENFREVIAPGLQTAARAGGNWWGSSDQDAFVNTANRNLSRSFADTAGEIAYKDFGERRKLRHEILMNKMGLDQDRAIAAAELDDSRERFAANREDELYQQGLDNLLSAATLEQNLADQALEDEEAEWRRTSPEYQAYEKEMKRRAAEEQRISKFAQLLQGGDFSTQTTNSPLSWGQRAQNILGDIGKTSDLIQGVKSMWQKPPRHSSWRAATTWRPSNHPRGV